MMNFVYSSAQTRRANHKSMLPRALIALALCVLTLAFTGCDLLKDRSATELVISDAK